MKQNKKSMLLNLSPDLHWQLGEIATALGKTKTAFIRQSIIRNLDFVRKHELPQLRQVEQNYKKFQLDSLF